LEMGRRGSDSFSCIYPTLENESIPVIAC